MVCNKSCSFRALISTISLIIGLSALVPGCHLAVFGRLTCHIFHGDPHFPTVQMHSPLLPWKENYFALS